MERRRARRFDRVLVVSEPDVDAIAGQLGVVGGGPPPVAAPTDAIAPGERSGPASTAHASGPRLRFLPGPPPAQAPAREPDTTLVILDTTWTPRADQSGSVVLLRDVVEQIMRERDLIAEAASALNGWVQASSIASILTHDGVSFWYGARLGHWMWLVDEILWLAVLDAVLAAHPGTRVLEFAPGADEGLVAAAASVAARDGLQIDEPGTPFSQDPSRAGMSGAASTALSPTVARRGLRRVRVLGRIRRRLLPTPVERRGRRVQTSIAAIAQDPARRLLVVQAHVRQRVETPAGPRYLNAYFGPIIDRLRDSVLDPFEVDIRTSLADDLAAELLADAGRPRYLPSEAPAMAAPSVDAGVVAAETSSMIQAVRTLRTPLVVSGVDLGPALADRVASQAATRLPRAIKNSLRIRGLLRRLHPAGILLADEYHRQDWLAAARAEGLPVAAVQHGVIYRWHNGYMHETRPDELCLPARTYVFGTWERDLLVGTSVYRSDEVMVGGSPRLDLVQPDGVDTAAVRKELGVADGDRMVVLSGTWGAMYRRFHYPIALTQLFARPLERVHLVVKLHPSEKDEGPYRAIIDGVAAAGGFAPPPMTVVQDIDLYRLLAAADAHLGIHSTVLTEAVATGTPNLLATGLAGSDLLGYVEAGVAIPVESAEDLVAALDLPRDGAMDPVRRESFLRKHFEPGDASRRIADDLVEWLA